MVLTQCACIHNKGIIKGLREASPHGSLTLMAVQRENPLGKLEKQDWRQSQDQHRTQKKIQDERVDTIGELWHKLWGKWGLPDEKLNTWTGTATDTHRQDRGSLPGFRMNPVTLLSHYSTSPSPLFSFNAQRTASLSLQLCKPIFHPLSPNPPLLPTFSLHFRNGCGNTSTDIQTASRLPNRAEGEPLSFFEKRIYKHNNLSWVIRIKRCSQYMGQWSLSRLVMLATLEKMARTIYKASSPKNDSIVQHTLVIRPSLHNNGLRL